MAYDEGLAERIRDALRGRRKRHQFAAVIGDGDVGSSGRGRYAQAKRQAAQQGTQRMHDAH